MLFAQLVDDPSSRPDEFPTEESQRVERDRLHRLIKRLLLWENVRDERLFAEAHAEILKSTDGNPPPILDPFAGGGTIPLEAQRLGLEAHASDLNPVAVLINKALIEIPPKFRDRPPVFPGLAESEFREWKGAEGLAADVRAYGQWVRDEAEKRIGHLYPKATLPDGTKVNVIAWIWARTVTCPNPACGIEMPLVRSWWLGRKKGKEAYVVPAVVSDPNQPSGRRVGFEIGHDPAFAPSSDADGTIGRTGARCVACDAAVSLNYIRSEGQAGRMNRELMAIVAEGSRRRLYLGPDRHHNEVAVLETPVDVPPGELPDNTRDFKTPNYGMKRFAELFTNRQLVTLTAISDLLGDMRERVVRDGGSASRAFAVTTYVGMAVSRTLNKSTSVCSWDSSPKMEAVRGLFARQAIPMAWDFAEANILGQSSGNFAEDIEWVSGSLDRLPMSGPPGVANQEDAGRRAYNGFVVSTDPPYYDNIGYADLSDFFYIWLRRGLQQIYPELLATMLVPKEAELVASPYRHEGRNGARQFFEDGFRSVFATARESAHEDYPITVWYAYKQSERDDSGTSSSGWETMLEGMIRSGWTITSTWPNRSELSNRMIASGTNALSSSIIHSLRPRPHDAPTIDRRGFIAALQSELPHALRQLQQGAVAAVDLPQAVVGPGMAVFSRYSAVLEPDGSTMSVRAALARINEIRDQVLNEQEGDFDPITRFSIAWYRLHGYAVGKYGDAERLATPSGVAVQTLDRHGVLSSRAGNVQLIKPADLGPDYDALHDPHTSTWEVLHHLIRTLEHEGIQPAGALLRDALRRPDAPIDADLVKELAHLLFRVAEDNKWTTDALGFNNLVTSWPEVVDAARGVPTVVRSSAQETLDYSDAGAAS